MLLLNSIFRLTLTSVTILLCLSEAHTQLVHLPEEGNNVSAGLVIESLNGGVLVMHGARREQQFDDTSIALIDLNQNLETISTFELSETPYLHAEMHGVYHFDQDHYLVLIEASDGPTDPFVYDNQIVFIKLNKDLKSYEELGVIDIDEGLAIVNPAVINLDDVTKRFYYTIINPGGVPYFQDIHYCDINSTSETISQTGITTVNPQNIYRDICYEDEFYFADITGLNRRNIEEDSFYVNIPINWPRQGNFFHDFSGIFFEIGSTNTIVIAGEYSNPFSSYDEFGVAVFDIDSLFEGGYQNEPKHLYTFDTPHSSRFWSNTIMQSPVNNTFWAVGGNFNLFDIFYPPFNNDGKLFVLKLDPLGNEIFRKVIDMNQYVYGVSSTMASDGSLYMGGYTIDLDSEEFIKGFVMRLNDEGELTSTFDLPMGDNLSVYPNPFSDILNTPELYGGDYLLLDILGQVVDKGSYIEHTIEMPSIPSGQYLLVVNSIYGSHVAKVYRE